MNYIIRFIGYIQIFITIIIFYYYIVAGFVIPNVWGLVLAAKITIFQFFIVIIVNLINYIYNKEINWFYILPFLFSLLPFIIISIFKIENLREFISK